MQENNSEPGSIIEVTGVEQLLIYICSRARPKDPEDFSTQLLKLIERIREDAFKAGHAMGEAKGRHEVIWNPKPKTGKPGEPKPRKPRGSISLESAKELRERYRKVTEKNGGITPRGLIPKLATEYNISDSYAWKLCKTVITDGETIP